VGESENFQIRLSQRFEKSFQDLIRSRYRGNDSANDFVEQVQSFIKLLEDSPRQKPPLGHLEPFPKGSSKDGWELWKLEFSMPHLKGSAKKGRLIYLFNSSIKEVELIWIYTHAEFQKRPDDKELKRIIQSIMSKSEDTI
jgi:hypothetical protein